MSATNFLKLYLGFQLSFFFANLQSPKRLRTSDGLYKFFSIFGKGDPKVPSVGKKKFKYTKAGMAAVNR